MKHLRKKLLKKLQDENPHPKKSTLFLLGLSVIPYALFLLVTSPVTIPLHYLLKAVGRKGFIRKEELENGGRTYSLVMSGGFKKAPL